MTNANRGQTDIAAYKIISEITERFNEITIQSKDLSFITDTAKEISGAQYAVLNKFDKDEQDFTTIAFSGMHTHLQKAISLLGFNLVGKRWNYDPLRQEKIKDNKTTIFNSLLDLTGEVLSKNSISLLCKLFTIEKIVIVKINKNDKMLGDFTLFFSAHKELQNRELMETYADLTGMLIKRLDSENETQQIKDQFQSLYLDEIVLDKKLKTRNVIQLRMYADRYRRAIEGTGAGLWDWDMVNNKVFFSQAWKTMLGYEYDEIENNFLSWKKLWHPEDSAKIEKSISDYMEGKTKVYKIEHRLRHKDGSWRWISTQGDIERDSSGKPIRWTGTNMDITERKQAEIENEKTKEQFALAVNGTNDGIWDWDIQSNELFLSKRWKEMLGYKDNEITNNFESFISLLYEEDVPRVNIYVQEYLKGAIDKYVIEFRMKHKTGTIVWILARGEALRDEHGIPYRMAGSHSNITERKKYEENLTIAKEQAEAANKAKSEFLANMSHEIRTPLNGVIGFTDLLMNTPLSPIQRQYAENANISGHTLLGIINDILDFSKIEAGMLHLEIIKSDLYELLNECLSVFSYLAKQKKITIFQKIDATLPRFVYTDPVRLKQILINLLGNAVKFTEKGEVELSTRYESISENQGKISFSIRDTGIGISEEQQKKLFQAFSQADSSTTRKFGGTGLGLIISDRIAQKMDSKIYLQSTLGEGSCFYFTITCDIENAEQKQTESPQNTIMQTEHTNKERHPSNATILIAEDVAMNMLVIASLIGKILPEANVIKALNGNEAVQQYEAFQPDLIFMDVQMPEMDGLEATKKIRELERISTKHVPIIALTAGAFIEEQEKCTKAGMDDFIAKPIEPHKIESILQRFGIC